MPRLRPTDARPLIADRAAPLLEEAADRSRVSMRTRLERLRVSWRSIVQAAVAAGVAWVIATELLGHEQPFFAPVSAIITLGLTTSQRGRRAVELAIGVAVGIAVGDLLVLAIGVGPGQLALVVALATAAAIFLGSGHMMATQAAVSAALVATLQPPTEDGVTFARFLDALVGGGVALVVNGLLLPAHPVAVVRSAARPLLSELAGTLDDIAAAIIERDRGLAERSLQRARGLDELSARFAEAVDVSLETTRYAPTRRRSRGRIEAYGRASKHIDFAVRNVRVLARGTIRAVRLGDNVPPDVADAVRDLAAAVRAFGDTIEHRERADRVREPALRAAATATLVLERTGNMSVNVLVGQVRSTATDMLAASGMSTDDAAATVTAAAQGGGQAV